MYNKNLVWAMVMSSLLVFSACAPTELKPAEYLEWCNDPNNELIKKFNQNSTELTCQYTSAEYVVLKQTEPAELNQVNFEEETNAINDMVHFKLIFEDTTSSNFLKNLYTTPDEYNLKTMYLSYDLQHDLHMVQGSDTAACALYHHERTYGNTPFETVLIAFPKICQTNCDTELIFNDRVFGLGRVKFFFSKESLENIPHVKI